MDKSTLILIIDDQLSVIKSLKRLLRKNKFQTVSAENAKEAISIINEKEISLIISDQRMPEITGTEFARQIRHDLKFNIPIIILSGYSNTDDIKQALKNNSIDLYLEKPWDNDALIEKINLLLSEKKESLNIKNPALEENEQEIKEINKFSENINDITLGDIAVEYKFITGEQLKSAQNSLKKKRAKGCYVSIENILFEENMINSDDMCRLIATTKRKIGKDFCIKAINKNLISFEDMDRVLKIQAKEFKETTTCRYIGDILIDEGLLEKDARDLILIEQLYSGNYFSETETPDSANNSHNKKKFNFFLKEKALDKLFGKIAIEKNYIVETEYENAVKEQIRIFSNYSIVKNIGDILEEKRLISNDEKLEILIQQKRKIPVTNDLKINEHIFNSFLIGYDNEFEILVSEDNTIAYIRFKKPVEEFYHPDEIKQFLNEHNIFYGIVSDEEINKILSFKFEKEKKYLIAKGKQEVKGRPSSIKYFFDTQYLSAGKEGRRGIIDFKSRGEIPFVESDTVIAEIIGKIDSKPGIKLDGEEFKTQTKDEIEFEIGTGVKISEDSTKLISTIYGQPEKSFNNKISVLPLKTIDEDVGFNTGHIIFKGNVEVNGCLKSEFKIEAANIKINEISGGEIIATGDVNVKDGIIGGIIWAQGNVTASYIKDSKIFAYKNVYVNNLLLDTKIISGGSYCSEKGKVISSDISMRKGGEILNVGTDISKPSILRINNNLFFQNELLRYERIIEENKTILLKLNKNLENLIKKNDDLTASMTELTVVREKQGRAIKDLKNKIENSSGEELVKNNKMLSMFIELSTGADKEVERIFTEQDKLFDHISDTKAKIEKYSKKIEKNKKHKKQFISWARKEKLKAKIFIKGNLLQGTVIEGNHSKIIVDKDVSNAKISEVTISDSNNHIGFKIKIETQHK